MKIKYQKVIFYFTVIILALIPLFWFTRFGGFLYIHNGVNTPVFPEENLNYLYVWNSNSLGQPDYLSITKSIIWLPYYGLLNLGISIRHAQMLAFPFLFSLPFISFYYGIKKILVDSKWESIYLGSLLYSINLYSVIMWHSGIYHSGSYIPYILAPIILGFHYELIKKANISLKFIIIFSLTLTLSLVHHAYSLAYILIPNFIFFLFFIRDIKIKHYWQRYMPVFSLTILMSIWWVIPMIMKYLSIFNNSLLNSAKYDITESVIITKQNLINILKLYIWSFGEEWGGRYFMSFSEAYIKYPFLTLIWFSILLFGFGLSGYYIYKTWKQKQNLNRKLIYFLYTVIFISVFLAKRDTPPFGELTDAIIKLPILNLLRNPETKLNGTYIFAFAILLTISFDYLSTLLNKTYKYISASVIGLFILIYAYPIFSGYAVIEVTKGNHFDRSVEISSEKMAIASDIKSKISPNLNILQIPATESNQWKTDDGNGYWGPDILLRKLRNPKLFRTENNIKAINLTSELLIELSESPDFSKNWVYLSRIGGILTRYDILNDTRFYNGELFENTVKTLLLEDNFEEISYDTKSGKINYYHNKDAENLSLIETSKNTAYYSGSLKPFLTNPNINEYLYSTNFIYDHNNEISTPTAQSKFILGGTLIDDAQAQTINTCKSGYLCYLIYNPLTTETEYTLSIKDLQKHEAIYLNDKLLDLNSIEYDGDNTKEVLRTGVNFINILTEQKIEEFNAEDIIKNDNYLEIELPYEENYDVSVFLLKYTSPKPIYLESDYTFTNNLDTQEPDISKIKYGFYPAGQGPLIVPVQSEDLKNVSSLKYKLAQSQELDTPLDRLQILGLAYIKTKVPSIYAENAIEPSNELKTQVKYKKVNPTKYTFGNDALDDNLIDNVAFYQSYSNYWKLYMANDNKFLALFPINTSQTLSKIFLRKPYYKEITDLHFIANGYANGWIIDHALLGNSDQSDKFDQFVIEYTPQRYVYFGLLIGFTTLTILLITLIILYLPKKYTEKYMVFVKSKFTKKKS